MTNDPVDEKFLKKVAKIVLKGENKNIRLRRKTLFLAAARNERLKKAKDVSVVLAGEKEIRNLNKKYRKKDKVTDVLSFDYGDSGEVVICLKEIKKNAEKFNNPFKKEIIRVLIHGILHLCGYDHEKSKKEAELMERKENSYFKIIFN